VPGEGGTRPQVSAISPEANQTGAPQPIRRQRGPLGWRRRDQQKHFHLLARFEREVYQMQAPILFNGRNNPEGIHSFFLRWQGMILMRTVYPKAWRSAMLYYQGGVCDNHP
jgi:hypothetical protein